MEAVQAAPFVGLHRRDYVCSDFAGRETRGREP
jgi:hypothetical protein